MKKRTVLMLFVSVMLMQSQAFAGPVNVDEGNWAHKLTRGLVNIVTSPLEIPRQVTRTIEEEGAAAGWTVGLVKGLGATVVRLGVGLVETVTCPFDFPEPKSTPLMEPEYAWQEWDITETV